MALDFRNTNLLWTSLLVATLHRLGLSTAIVCPGSRSGPLAIAVAQHPDIEALPILDERSAAFFALGHARRTGQPTALICTSGTAGANFYPAVIEACESRIPLLVLTADRPPELRHCHAGQAIDQVKLFGHYPNWQAELALPSATFSQLTYLRQTLVHAWSRTLAPTPGVVHLNVPFRDPLAPMLEPEVQKLAADFPTEQFLSALQPGQIACTAGQSVPQAMLATWQQTQRGLIIAGPAQPLDGVHYCDAIATLATHLNWPVLAEGLSPLRNHADRIPNLITTYDFILRQPALAHSLAPDVVLRIGELPTSKILRTWLQATDVPQWIIDPSDHNLDPLHGRTVHLQTTVQALAQQLRDTTTHTNLYWQHWQQAERQTRQSVDQTLASTQDCLESKIAWLLSQHLPNQTPIFIANSMPARDVEYVWQPNTSRMQPFFNRGGANGIDGTLSTALGVAHRYRPTVLLTGDLALLHDTNGLLLQSQFQGHLTIVLINNNGGGIFEMLPIAEFDPPFETYFATPQAVDFAQLAATYGVEHLHIPDWETLVARLNPLPTKGIRVLEIVCDRKQDAQWRKTKFSQFAATVELSSF